MNGVRKQGVRSSGGERNSAIPVFFVFAALMVCLSARHAGAAEFTWKGNGGTTANPKDGMWRAAAHWMGGAPPANNAATELVFNVGSSAYTATNNNGGVFFNLNKLTLTADGDLGKEGTILGSPIQFVKNGNTDPKIVISRTVQAGGGNDFHLFPNQIKTDVPLSIEGTGMARLIIGDIAHPATSKGRISGSGSIVQKSGMVWMFGHEDHNTLHNAAGPTYALRNGILMLEKGNKTAVNGDLEIGGTSAAGSSFFARADWFSSEQVADNATISLTARASPNPPLVPAVTGDAEMRLIGTTETIRGLQATVAQLAGATNTVTVDIQSGHLWLKGDYAAATRHAVRASLHAFAPNPLIPSAGGRITKEGRNYTWVFEGNGDNFQGSVDLVAGAMEVANGSQLGKNEAGKKCAGVTVRRRAMLRGAANINCKVTEEARGGPGPAGLGLTVELGGQLVPKSQTDMVPSEDPDAPPAPFDAPGILSTLELLMAEGSVLEIGIDGGSAGNGPGYHSQLHVVDGDAVIDGSHLQLSLTYPPSLGNEYTILRNDGISSVQGSFAGKPQGSYYTAYHAGNPYIFQVNYFGGDGNDVVLTNVAVPEPSTGLLALLGIIAAVRTGRRRQYAATASW